MRLSPGATFDRYVIEALLGEGGMGQVYCAMDPRLHRKVALKVLRRDTQEANETWTRAVARMQREARAAAGLNHPNTVAIYDVGEHEGMPFIAMELVDGEPLRAHIGGPLPYMARLSILRDVARALAAAHREGLVHRDIKPENVMVRQDGVVKVLDFGIARKLSVGIDAMGPTMEGAMASVTGPGLFMGTPAYMAPEQVRGEDIDPRIDQFAWGVLAYEFLSGRLPFRTDKGPVGLIASILTDTPPPLPSVPDDLETILRRTLSKDPNDRFESMDELIDKLSTFFGPDSGLTPASYKITAGSGTPAAQAATTQMAALPLPSNTITISRSRLAFGALGILVVMTVLVISLMVSRFGSTSSPGPSTSAVPPTAPTIITDLPLPKSDSREALVAYREGMQALRDGAWELARSSFDRARKLDAALTSAHMRYALATMPFEPDNARKAFQTTILQRASLSERDQGLVDALEPYMQRNPPDRLEASKRLEALAQRFPGDAELALWRATMASTRPEEVLLLVDTCLALDSKYADCWQQKAFALDMLGQTEQAIIALDRCLDSSIGAVDCVASRAEADLNTGQCEHLEQTSRRWITLMPNSGFPYHRLAMALLALGRPDEAVHTAVEQASQKYGDSGDTLMPRILAFELAVALGDFKSADKHLRELGPRVDERSWQVDAALYPGLYFEEIGKPIEAGKAAATILTRREGLPHADGGPWTDRTLELRAMMLHAGLIQHDEYVAERTAWLRAFDNAAPARRMEAWYIAYAMPARTEEDAREALSTLPAFAPLPHNLPTSIVVRGHILLGKVYFLAGDMQSALPHLASPTGCHQLAYPFAHVHNIFRLGVAREVLGDRQGACVAYQYVIDRWGPSKVSITAKEAAKRAKALGCDGKSRR